MPKIRFHSCAHKTATTHQQHVLGSSSFHPGTRFVPLSLLRRTLTTPVRRSRPHLPWHRWYNGVWLLSDEKWYNEDLLQLANDGGALATASKATKSDTELIAKVCNIPRKVRRHNLATSIIVVFPAGLMPRAVGMRHLALFDTDAIANMIEILLQHLYPSDVIHQCLPLIIADPLQ